MGGNGDGTYHYGDARGDGYKLHRDGGGSGMSGIYGDGYTYGHRNGNGHGDGDDYGEGTGDGSLGGGDGYHIALLTWTDDVKGAVINAAIHEGLVWTWPASMTAVVTEPCAMATAPAAGIRIT
jgi:hypothetical protein